ncbi:MAG TPA: LLM class flavin-dependent oxidoreductase [Solirubrobacteraceae bacterium]|jgi:alkanesulfonate monooxygenase SsuD/methylene tetrahydromethanopterin reductase-like flavin-dependent oxidoreductase (luciferase family)|nr:LLM class flavin-dependent oxidoreductase [Solirubrobacteraceae bacterium]
MTVSFGLVYDFRSPRRWVDSWGERARALLDQIAWVDEQLSIDAVRVTEHHFYQDGYLPAPLGLCTAIAARTRRVEVGTNLILLPLHQPIRVAEESLVIDALSGGRFTLGIGAGYSPVEFGGYGISPTQRPSRLEEGMKILRGAFAGEPFSHDGRRYQVDPVTVTPAPVRPGGPPIWGGAFAPVAVERVARLCDGFLSFGLLGADVYRAECERLGRPRSEQRLNGTYFAMIAEDPERAYAKIAPHYLYMINGYITNNAFPGLTPFDDAKAVLRQTEEMGFGLLTDAAGAIERFNGAIDAGAVSIDITPVIPGEDLDHAAERLQYLSDHVIPHLKAPP